MTTPISDEEIADIVFPCSAFEDLPEQTWERACLRLCARVRADAETIARQSAELVALRRQVSHGGPPLYRCACCGCPVSDHAVDFGERRECTVCECRQYLGVAHRHADTWRANLDDAATTKETK